MKLSSDTQQVQLWNEDKQYDIYYSTGMETAKDGVLYYTLLT